MKKLLFLLCMIPTLSYGREFNGVEVGDAKLIHQDSSGMVIISDAPCTLGDTEYHLPRITVIRTNGEVISGCVSEIEGVPSGVFKIGDKTVAAPLYMLTFKEVEDI